MGKFANEELSSAKEAASIANVISFCSENK
jgi:hypothetical protein